MQKDVYFEHLGMLICTCVLCSIIIIIFINEGLILESGSNNGDNRINSAQDHC